MYYHKWSLSEIERMIPWELDAYCILLMQKIEEENEKTKIMAQKQGRSLGIQQGYMPPPGHRPSNK